MPNYAIIRIEKRKSGAIGRVQKHHERQKDTYKTNPDIDVNRIRENYHLKEPDGSYRKRVVSRVEEVGARTRKDSVLMQDGLITATPEWIGAMTKEEQRAFFEYAYTFIRERYGEENMVSCVVHMDEKTPHMHFVFVPVTKDGRLSSKEIIGGPAGLRELQDTFYGYMHERYPDLDRGIPARVSERKHIPTYMFKTMSRLKEHQQEIEEAVRDIGVIGNRDKREHALELLEKYMPEMLKAEEHLETTDRYISELEKSIEAGKERAAELTQRNEVLKKQLTSKDNELKYHKMEHSDTKEALRDANRKLLELNREQRAFKSILDQIPKEVYEKITGLQGKEPEKGPYSRQEQEKIREKKQKEKELPERKRNRDFSQTRPRREERGDDYDLER